MDRYSPEDSELIASLVALSARNPKLVKSIEYAAPADETIKVRSWRMNEFKYYDVPSPFPTLARGLFTVEDRKKYQIVARGYDKFFNIGEVPWTTWESLEAHTSPPYTLSLKSNGCIIFIAALTRTKLIVTSKHSLGRVAGSKISHAQAGEQWLRRYLAEKDKTEAELAGVLWKENWTAIAELCDDSFEEHVLPYPPELTGLHLHGLNHTGKDFRTAPQPLVDAFAAEWGFIRTRSIVLNSIEEVRSFTAEVGKSGNWEGEAVEGFVVRSVVGESPPGEEQAQKARGGGKGKGKGTVRSPYAPGSSFFFKIKFDEPYMMYRDWREITKSLITSLSSKGEKTKRKENEIAAAVAKNANVSAVGKAAIASLPSSKMQRPETKRYALWVCAQIEADLERNNGQLGEFADFGKGKGIIKTREKFLAWLSGEGAIQGEHDAAKPEWGKTIIVPIAIPGSGKTAVSVALAHLFGFGHTQSDDVRNKKPAPFFIKNVVKLLNRHDVVIADKNNHLIKHRQSLRQATESMSPPVRLVALNWNHILSSSASVPSSNAEDALIPLSLPAIHHLACDRILARGPSHQTLVADRTAARAHEAVVWMFIEQAQELGTGECDEEILMNISDDLDQGVRRAVDGVCRVLGLPKPSEEKIVEAVERAKGYAPKTTADEGNGRKSAPKGKTHEPRYYAVVPEVNLASIIGGRFDRPDVDEAARNFWERLKSSKRVPIRPHITLVHRNSLPDSQSYWEVCAAVDAYGLSENTAVPPQFEARMGHIVWDGRVMAVTIDELRASSGADAGSEGGKLADALLAQVPEDTRSRLHITVGTKDDKTLAVEAKAMVEAWRRGDTAAGKHPQIHSVSLVEGGGEGQGIVVAGRVRGLR
ncbi:hypothetical protein HGRIS_000120 [Hohenbuehelia grisea]|uniref:tRNA ligase n=1 Tax=Hohenbuehelia grisea TaxID=104357 RepID=A0ABR3JQQ7_9AGAR